MAHQWKRMNSPEYYYGNEYLCENCGGKWAGDEPLSDTELFCDGCDDILKCQDFQIYRLLGS